MFSFHSKYFVCRELKKGPQKLSFCFKIPDTGTVRILGNILYSSEDFKENINIVLLLTGSFPPKPLKTTAHGLPKISRNLSSNGPTFDKKYKKGFLFPSIGIKQGKMDTETSKIALKTYVHLRTANQPMSRPECHVDDICDMRRSCRLSENTSGRRPLGSSSRLLKVPNRDLKRRRRQ